LETAAREFAAELAVRRHDVTMVTGVGPGARLQPDVRSAAYRVVAVPMLGQTTFPARLLGRARGVHPSVVEARTFWAMARRTKRAMRALESSDVVSAHFEVEAVLASRQLHIPLAYYYAGPLDPRRLARARFARMVAISQMVADYHASLAGRFDLPPVSGVVQPGVREESIADGPAPGVMTQPPEAIFTGRLDATGEKRVDKLIEWWPRIIEAVPGARLTLLGGGSALDALKRGVKRAELEDVVSLPGPLPHSEVAARLRRASLYVFPSRFETFGIAPLEAMAAGLPVVASDIPALRESLGDAALLLPVGDDVAWISALVRLLSNPAERLEWAERGPVRARQLTWARQTEAYEAHLVAAANSSSVGSGSEGAERTARRRA
jgi:glycosyltransferase involved in cell wall biosynthesis